MQSHNLMKSSIESISELVENKTKKEHRNNNNMLFKLKEKLREIRFKRVILFLMDIIASSIMPLCFIYFVSGKLDLKMLLFFPAILTLNFLIYSLVVNMFHNIFGGILKGCRVVNLCHYIIGFLLGGTVIYICYKLNLELIKY